jgi:hypothetical protein
VTGNPFRSFFDAGYQRLIPVVPPGAPLSPNSSLAKRMERDATKDARGKAPGVLGGDGLWRGVDWLKIVVSEQLLDEWNSWQAGVGIRTGAGLVAVDIDTLDPQLAKIADDAASELLGPSPARIGRAPKTLRVYRCTEDRPYQRATFAGGIVELLTEGKQFVASGIHPKTGKPYEWQPYAMPFTALVEVTGVQLDAFFARLTEILPATEISTEATAARADVDQAQLAGNPDTVDEAVAALPNNFEDRDSYIRVGAAIKAAIPDDPEHGLELFQDWASKWHDYDADNTASDWKRLKPPFSVGAQYLYSLASEHGDFSTADAWFTGSSAPAGSAGVAKTIWDEAPAEAEPELPPLQWANTRTWRQTEAPKREWEVDGFIPRGVVTLVYGEGGVGKTLVMHQYAACAAAGVKWLGQPTRPARVMCVFCEDDEDELHRRHQAIIKACGIEGDSVDDNLRIISRAGEDNLIVGFSRSGAAMQKTAFWHQLNREADAWQPDVLILDTIADIYGGSEIDRMQVNQFVKVGLGGLAPKNSKRSVIALGHPSVAGRSEGRSGSTAWSNASRHRNYMRRPKGKEKGNEREIEGMKTNRGAVGNLLQVEWKAGAFSIVASSTQIDLNAFKEAAVASVAREQTTEGREEAAVLAAVAAARTACLPLGMSARSYNTYAPRALRVAFPEIMRLVRGDDAIVEDVMRRLLSSGRVRAATWRNPARRHDVSGYEVVTAASAGTDIFN